jgi:hypothetical protein
MRLQAVLVGVLIAAAGCNLRKLTVGLTAPVFKAGQPSFSAEPDIEIARAAAPAQLKEAEGLLESSPKNRDLLELLARGYLEFAFGFVEDDYESLPDDARHLEERQAVVARATGLYERALGFSLRLIGTYDKRFPAALAGSTEEVRAAVARLPRAAAPGLLYGGMALAESINLNRADLSRAVDLPKAIAMVERARALDPKLRYCGAAMTLGNIYAQPAARGGQPEKAKRYFDEAIACADGKYLLSRVMMARNYAVAVGDRQLFESTLRMVLATSPDLLPAARLSNALAKRRAARYLELADVLFAAPTPPRPLERARRDVIPR